MRAPAVCVVLAMVTMALGADGPPSFRAARPIVPAGAGPNRLPVDVPLLAGARPLRFDAAGVFVGGLDDLRLLDRDGRELPYLVIGSTVPADRWQEGTVAPVLATRESSGFEADLGAPATIDRIRFAGLPPPFLKRGRVEGSGDRSRWIVLVAEATVFDLPDQGLERVEVAVAPATVRYVRVTWDDRASARVPPPAHVAVRLAAAAVPPPPVLAPLVFERRPSEPGTSRFRVHLPGATLPLHALVLDSGESRLLRSARVTEPSLVGESVSPRVLGSATLRRVVQDGLVAADLRIPLAAPREPELELVVDDGDNPPLELSRVDAELPPLPWIYFESPDGTALMARFGAADLAAPRYDLEAFRSAARDTAPPEATWGELVHTPAPEAPPPPAPTGLVTVGAPLDVTTFRYARALPAGPGGLVALRLDAAALAHSADLADLRIVDPGGRQVPYVIEHVDEPLAIDLPVPSPMPSADAPHGHTVYELTLPYARLPPARLVLDTDARVFERHVIVRAERRDDERARAGERFETLRTVAWRHVDPNRPAPSLVIDLPMIPTAVVRLEIDDGDNSPLPVRAPRLLLPTKRLRFVRVDGVPLSLVYGARGLAAPRYDLALLAGHVVGAVAVEIEALPEAGDVPEASDVRGTARERRVFWGVLVVAVVALLLVLARLLRVEAPPDPAGPDARAPS